MCGCCVCEYRQSVFKIALLCYQTTKKCDVSQDGARGLRAGGKQDKSCLRIVTGIVERREVPNVCKKLFSIQHIHIHTHSLTTLSSAIPSSLTGTRGMFFSSQGQAGVSKHSQSIASFPFPFPSFASPNSPSNRRPTFILMNSCPRLLIPLRTKPQEN